MSEPELSIRIVGGGRREAIEEAAIAAVVTRIVRARDRQRSAAPSAWALAGRVEGNGIATIRSRAALLGL